MTADAWHKERRARIIVHPPWNGTPGRIVIHDDDGEHVKVLNEREALVVARDLIDMAERLRFPPPDHKLTGT